MTKKYSIVLLQVKHQKIVMTIKYYYQHDYYSNTSKEISDQLFM
ncbi:MAG TPA: hypothetical protein PK345_00820 [Bacteroidales bacterium]|jgi:hypothetical protein|nr:MAG: hypothetical protein BWX63_01331 [Bacteroidetes bacterium ADurb.Bin041]HNV51176.1 hypothetical protein [Bacteroidales bacterium]HNY60433.1 hypothetical protein [Bacteroidales bacterium]HOG67601.1 hypothetical protein [Bacteroidales bacterium]HPA13380.1 hypothetical protein [Bacteroidales bacterium]